MCMWVLVMFFVQWLFAYVFFGKFQSCMRPMHIYILKFSYVVLVLGHYNENLFLINLFYKNTCHVGGWVNSL